MIYIIAPAVTNGHQRERRYSEGFPIKIPTSIASLTTQRRDPIVLRQLAWKKIGARIKQLFRV
jgi:hypothetical protein